MQKGLEFYLEYDGIYEDDNWSNKEFLKPLEDLAQDYDIVSIQDIGFYESSGNLVFHGYIIDDTKKEVNAHYTLFKSALTKTLTSMGYKKPKAIDRMKLYYDKLRRI